MYVGIEGDTAVEHAHLPTSLLVPMHVKHTIPYVYNSLLADEPSVSKYVEDIKKLEIKILIYK